METVYKISEEQKKRFMLKRYAVGLDVGKYLYSAYVNEKGTAKIYRVAGLKDDKYEKFVKSLEPMLPEHVEYGAVVARVKAKVSGKRLYQYAVKSPVEAKETVLDEAVPVVKDKIVKDIEADTSLKTEVKKCPICGKVGKKTCRECTAVVTEACEGQQSTVEDAKFVAVSEGTLVKMGDGSIEKVEDIKQGHMLKTSKDESSRVVEVNLREVIDEEKYKEDEETWRKDDETPIEEIVAVCNNPVNLKGVFEKGIEYFYKGEHPLNDNLIYVEDSEGKKVLVNRNQFSLR